MFNTRYMLFDLFGKGNNSEKIEKNLKPNGRAPFRSKVLSSPPDLLGVSTPPIISQTNHGLVPEN